MRRRINKADECNRIVSYPEFKVITHFEDVLGHKFCVGDMVTIKYLSGGGVGGCTITKITKTG